MSKERLAPASKEHASSSREGARDAPRAAALRPPPYGIELADSLRASVESLSGIDLSGVRVHRNSPEPERVNALAYTQGQEIHLGPGQESHLAHELWHVVQQGQGRVPEGTLQVGGHTVNDDARLEQEADRMGARALGQVPSGLPAALLASPLPGGGTSAPLQRAVRTNGGAKQVDETYYQSGAGKGVGAKRKVSDLVADPVRRVFKDAAELESYADGKTDYIGDVKTAAAGTYWYRLPKDKLTVLGERHENPKGNVEDVILGLGTSRFMYEPYNAVNSLQALNVPLTGTQTRLNAVNTGRRTASMVDTTGAFDPSLEDIVIKALTGASVARNEFIDKDPANMSQGDRKTWQGRASTNDYSYGERVALYLSFAIHIAADLSKHDFGKEQKGESTYLRSARRLKNNYVAHKATLDAFMTEKDADDLVGIYELTASKRFRNLRDLKRFTVAFHEYATSYIEQLGTERKNQELVNQGQALAADKKAGLDALSPAREEIMWERIQDALAGQYLLVGMGENHRRHLKTRLDKAGIRHAEVTASLEEQKVVVDSGWVP